MSLVEARDGSAGCFGRHYTGIWQAGGGGAADRIRSRRLVQQFACDAIADAAGCCEATIRKNGCLMCLAHYKKPGSFPAGASSSPLRDTGAPLAFIEVITHIKDRNWLSTAASLIFAP
ncbi:hypothetical protein [Noviherbaspirillum soli]|uniref:hypothetical protein n=1 Tax=Noviherbaspirillum soli TaxID=1064518 RepID=UPI00188B9F9F|nr:hypothetical protein [Noviherbaspirillum soli]